MKCLLCSFLLALSTLLPLGLPKMTQPQRRHRRSELHWPITIEEGYGGRAQFAWLDPP